jgi:hypothetical protein
MSENISPVAVAARSARPSTAQRRPPKIKDNTMVSSGPGKATADAVTGVMKEGGGNDSDSDKEETKGDDGFGAGFASGG